MSTPLHRLLLVTGVTALGIAAEVHAARPPQVDEEADDVAARREAYYAIRRINPYDSSFDASTARLRAYRAFRATTAPDAAVHARFPATFGLIDASAN